MTAFTEPSGFLSLVRVATLAACAASAGVLAAQTEVGGPARVAVIDVQRLVFESETGKEVLERLKTLREQKTAEGQVLQQEAKDLRDRLQEGRLSLSDEKTAELEKQLEDKMIELRRFSDDADRQLQKEQEEAFSRIEAEMMPIITELGREQGFTLIFNKFNSGLLFAIDEVDITDLILQRYDVAASEEN